MGRSRSRSGGRDRRRRSSSSSSSRPRKPLRSGGGGFGGGGGETAREAPVKVGVYKELDDEEKRRQANGEPPLTIVEKDLLMRNFSRKEKGLPPLAAGHNTGGGDDKGGKGKGKGGKGYGKEDRGGKGGYGKDKGWKGGKW
eukprot:TRINITY_DN812_c0_g1_i1.p1 TRINITY_DN812_c0_g1~~TRINITY_DN812_c0_g1_i1.p1  ORF type:complete len:141 (-),score=26.56 TRINITY_DN812_c0_g1_i1:134-556(-)